MAANNFQLNESKGRRAKEVLEGKRLSFELLRVTPKKEKKSFMTSATERFRNPEFLMA